MPSIILKRRLSLQAAHRKAAADPPNLRDYWPNRNAYENALLQHSDRLAAIWQEIQHLAAMEMEARNHA